MAGDFAIKRIIEKRTSTVKNKKTVQYLVDWEPSWVPESEVTPNAVAEFERAQNKPIVLGPHKASMTGSDKTKWSWVIQYGDEFEIATYEIVTTTYNAEFIKYCLERMDAN
uniref:Chromo domain-containing protein n=1 Tax=Panagrellus redivivus TaxID=6233 RepID=A0A7E4UZG2_PANRE